MIRVQQRSKVDSNHVDVIPPLKSQGRCVKRAGGPDEPSPGGSAPSSAKGYFPGGTVSYQIARQSPSSEHCAGVEEEGDDALSSKGDAMAATRLEEGHSEATVPELDASSNSVRQSNPVNGSPVGSVLGDEFPGLQQPFLKSGVTVTGETKNIHRRENKQKRIAKQLEQEPVTWWKHHKGEYSIPTPKSGPAVYKGSMCPSGLALHHPAAEKLLQFATEGCPARTGKPWTKEQMEEAIARGPHVSALEKDAMEQLEKEVYAKEKKKQCKVVLWDDIKDNPPKELKVSPIAMIPHKSRLYRAILDLSFSLRLKNGTMLAAVNESSEKTAPGGAIDQLGFSLARIIHAFAEAGPDEKVFVAKWDIKDGFWRLDCATGEEWNFAYVLPQPDGAPIKLVVPTSLQMGWIESPPYFCAASETGRDVAEDYVETPVGSLPPHKFAKHSGHGKDFDALPETSADERLKYMVEVFVDDFVALAIPTSRQQLQHVATAVMSGVHDVFPADEVDEEDPLSLKKMLKEESMWALTKDVLGFGFDGWEKTIWLEEGKRDALLTTLHQWIRSANKGRCGIPFDQFESVTSKLRHAFTSIPNGNGLMTPFNRILQTKAKFVFLCKNVKLLTAVRDCRALLRISTLAPTKCKELVAAWPDFIGVKDASKHGVGGIMVGENAECIPTVFRYEWPDDIKADLVSEKNPKGRITNSDLEMAGLLMLWLVMENVCDVKPGTHAALFSDNQPTVSWVNQMASKSSDVAGQLLRALSLRLKMKGVSPLTTLHVPGKQNAMTDIPSRSFGSNPQWYCKTDTDLLNLFNKKFPLPNQASWTVFRPTKEICTRVLSVLRMQATTMEEWTRLPKVGELIGEIGSPSSNLWEWTLTYRMSHTKSESDASLGLEDYNDLDTMVARNKYKLEQSLRRSQPLARRLLWPMK